MNYSIRRKLDMAGRVRDFCRSAGKKEHGFIHSYRRCRNYSAGRMDVHYDGLSYRRSHLVLRSHRDDRGPGVHV